MKAVIMCFLFCASSWAQEGSPGGAVISPAAEEHIRQVIASLPPESALRRDLERGERANGVRYPWMDKMRQQGVRRAVVQTEFIWRGRSRGMATKIRATRFVYFSKYDWDCAQISDPHRLAQIRASGLEDDLGKAAAERTLHAHWFAKMHEHRAKHGSCNIELFDDEWLRRILPNFLGGISKPLFAAADLHDLEEVKGLLKAGVSPDERDEAFWFNLVDDDPCMETLFIRAGTDVNYRNQAGSTPLMLAVGYRALGNVKALLAAGADVNAKANNGDTALSIASQKSDKLMIEFLKQSGAHY